MSKINIIVKKDSNINEVECAVTTGGLVKVVLPANISESENILDMCSYIDSHKASLTRDAKKSLEGFRKQLQQMIEKIECELNLKEMGFYMGTSLRIEPGKVFAGITVNRIGLGFQVNLKINPISSLIATEDLEVMLKHRMARATMSMLDGIQNSPIFFCDIYNSNGEKLEKSYKELTREQEEKYLSIAEVVFKNTSQYEKSAKFKEALKRASCYQMISVNV